MNTFEQWFVRYPDGELNPAIDESCARRWQREAARYPERLRCVAVVRREPGGPIVTPPVVEEAL